MEDKNKKNFSTILLVVGVLFIVVSGGIFVSRTWHYLPEAVKKLCICGVTAGFFAGAHYLTKNSLNKAGIALYYLGVCFTGFSATALLSVTEMDPEWIRLLTMLAMSVPVGIRFYKERSVVDLVIQIFLCDGMILSTSNLDGNVGYGETTFLCFATFTMALSALLYYSRKTEGRLWGDAFCGASCKGTWNENAITTVAGVAYFFHLIVSVPCLLLLLFAKESFFYSVFPVLMIIGSVSVAWFAFDKCRIFRIVQSVFLAYGTFAIFFFFLRDDAQSAFFMAFVATMILMIVLDRKELFVLGSFVTVSASFLQIMAYSSGNEVVRHAVSAHPYGIFMAITLLAWNHFSEKKLSGKLIYRFTILFALINFNGLCSYLEASYAENYGIEFMSSFALLLIAFWIEDRGDKPLVSEWFQSTAALLSLAAVMVRPMVKTVFLEESTGKVVADFGFEYIIIFMGLGIVLLGKIWYDKIAGVRKMQFVGSCLLMAALVLENLARPALPNVLFLGFVALATLIVATILKQKGYAILAAVTLILVALYVTRELWMSIAWWVYLFAAGVGLVAFAIKKEKAEN